MEQKERADNCSLQESHLTDKKQILTEGKWVQRFF
jgi:hypothetical protein